MAARAHTRHTYHFDLAFLTQSYQGAYVQTPLGRYPLVTHDDESRTRSAGENRAIAAMPAESRARLTHYAADVQVPIDAPFLMRVHAPNIGTAPLPILIGVKVTIPGSHLRDYRREDLAVLTATLPPHYAHFGIAMPAGAGDDALLDLMSDADLLSYLPLDTAAGIAFSHPNMCSTSVRNASIIHDRHILRSKGLMPFASDLAQLGPGTEDGGFCTITPCTYPDSEQPIAWREPYAAAAGGPDATIHTYNLSTKLTGSPPMKGKPRQKPEYQTGAKLINQALGGVTNDMRLRDSHWSVTQSHLQEKGDPGVTARGFVDPARFKAHASRRAMAAADAESSGGYSFTINNKTPGHGLKIYADSIKFDTSANKFSIDLKNCWLRTLGTHVRFYDSDSNVIPDPAGNYPQIAELFDVIKDGLGLDKAQRFLGFIYAVYAIMDIPVPISPTTVEFPWPETAETCDILLGGMGFGNWDTTADLLGLIATAIFQFGVPIIFFIGGASIKSSTWYEKLMKDREFLAALVICAAFIYVAVAVVAYELGLAETLFFTTTNFLAGLLAGEVVGVIAQTIGRKVAKIAVEELEKILTEGFEKLGLFITVKLTTAEAIDAIPFAGWAAEALNIALTLGALGESAGEVIASPATYTITVVRKLQVTATVSPDPLHGAAGNPPIWPASATHYKAVLQYKNGSAMTITGALPVEQADRADPVTVVFDDVPSGGQFQITFSVYSNTDWLAGIWTGPWTDAVIPEGGGALSVGGSIIEQLVPLTADTQYLYNAKLVYSDQAGHQWSADGPPAKTRADLSPDGLNRLVAITGNNGAYMIGYTWQAAGQNVPFKGDTQPTDGLIYTFQNINTLSDPEASLKFPSCGFSAATFLAYEQFGPEPLFSAPSSVQSDLDQGVVDDTLRTAFQTAGYPLPDQVTVDVVETTVEWTLTLAGGSSPTYQLDRQSDGSIFVYLYPTDTVGQNNFYVDTSGEPWQFRKVTLDNTTPFDMTSTTSYGCFVQNALDAVVVHPADYMVGVSYDNHYLEVVPILEEGVPDDQVIPGTLLSGPGVRQGLLRGPRALSITQDGRILVLETQNRRVQAFDVNANPVACFDAGEVTTLSAATYEADLDQSIVSADLRDAFAAAGVALSQHWMIRDGDAVYEVVQAANNQLQLNRNGAPLSASWQITNSADNAVYAATLGADAITVTLPGGGSLSLPTTVRDDLDMGIVDLQMIAAFAGQQITLSPQSVAEGSGLYVDPSATIPDLCRGIVPAAITDALASVYLSLSSAAMVRSEVTCTVRAPATSWLINDPDAAASYAITLDAADIGQLVVTVLSPFVHLQTDGVQTDRTGTDADSSGETYLDLTTEMKGYLYVLGYTGTGSQADQYFLDLYDPLGHFLSRTPDSSKGVPGVVGVNVERITVDMWRTLFGLSFESLTGPGGRTEPSVTQWFPSTPDG